MADDLLISRAAGLEIGLRRGERGQRLRAAGFCLGHVGAGHLADIEPVLGRLELLGQHGDVVLAQTHDRLVAHHVDISGRGIEQDGLLDAAQHFARRLHGRLRLPDGVEILEAFEQRLGQLHRIATRIGHPVVLTDFALTECLVKGDCSCAWWRVLAGNAC